MSDRDDLTDRQAEALEFIETHLAQRGFPPTFREIGDAMGITSPNGVMNHLRALENKGHIERRPNSGRGITVLHLSTGPNIVHMLAAAETELAKYKRLYEKRGERIEELAGIAEKLERLQAIVDKLPKDADGVPVPYDTRLYFVHPELDEIWDWRLDTEPVSHCVLSVEDDEDCFHILPKDCHVSREAAEAALADRLAEMENKVEP